VTNDAGWAAVSAGVVLAPVIYVWWRVSNVLHGRALGLTSATATMLGLAFIHVDIWAVVPWKDTPWPSVGPLSLFVACAMSAAGFAIARPPSVPESAACRLALE